MWIGCPAAGFMGWVKLSLESQGGSGGFMVSTGWAHGWLKVGLEWLRVG